MDLPPGVKRKIKKRKRKTNPNTDDVCYAHLCLLLGRSESKFCLFISSIHIQTSSFENLVYSKINVYQGWKVSKSLWLFLCVFKSLWSRGVKPTRFWMCNFGHSLQKVSSRKSVNPSLPRWRWHNRCCFRPWWILISYQLWRRASTQSLQSPGPGSLR